MLCLYILCAGVVARDGGARAVSRERRDVSIACLVRFTLREVVSQRLLLYTSRPICIPVQFDRFCDFATKSGNWMNIYLDNTIYKKDSSTTNSTYWYLAISK